MYALVIPIVTAMAISAASGGHLGRLRHARFDWILLATSALVTQILLFSPVLETRDWAIRLGPGLYVLSMVIVLLVLVRNATLQTTRSQQIALSAAALGVLLNCMVVAANGGYMPRRATEEHPAVLSPMDAGRLVNVTPMGADTRLWWLGDVLAEPSSWPNSNVFSLGDVLLATGLGCWVLLSTRPRAAALARERIPFEKAET